mgnify:CR=1 FL=1
MWGIRKILAALLAPAALLALSYAIVEGNLSLMPGRSSLTGRLLPLIPCGLAVPGVVFGLVYRHERVAYAAIALALGNLALTYLWPVAPASGASWTVGYAALAVLLPGYLLYAALFSPQGIFTIQGVMRLLLIIVIAQAVLMAVDGVLPTAMEAGLNGVLHYRLFDAKFDSWSHLPQPAMILIVLATGILLVLFLRWPEPGSAAFMGAILATAGALDAVGDGLAVALYFGAAQTMLLAALAVDAYGMAFLDELTNLPGRRALFADLGRLGSRYTVAMVDVDHFKKFNDTYGHDVGDQVLLMVASKLAAVRGGGASYKYGGEEFTVLFPGQDATHARPHLEDLRQAIAAASFRLRGKDRPPVPPHGPPNGPPDKGASAARAGDKKKVGVTVSIGLAEAANSLSPEDVLKESDKALYKAKKSGRNRVV